MQKLLVVLDSKHLETSVIWMRIFFVFIMRVGVARLTNVVYRLQRIGFKSSKESQVLVYLCVHEK